MKDTTTEEDEVATAKLTKLTPRQEDVKRLLEAEPDISVGDAAERLGLATGTTYKHMRDLRNKGVIPKGKRRGGKRAVKRVAKMPTPSLADLAERVENLTRNGGSDELVEEGVPLARHLRRLLANAPNDEAEAEVRVLHDKLFAAMTETSREYSYRTNGSSAQEVVTAELESVTNRIEEIRAEAEKLSTEEGQLATRREKLSNAQSALA